MNLKKHNFSKNVKQAASNRPITYLSGIHHDQIKNLECKEYTEKRKLERCHFFAIVKTEEKKSMYLLVLCQCSFKKTIYFLYLKIQFYFSSTSFIPSCAAKEPSYLISTTSFWTCAKPYAKKFF